MNRRLYFTLIGLGCALALGGAALQTWSTYHKLEKVQNVMERSNVKVCRLAKELQTAIKDARPDEAKKLPELVGDDPHCQLEK